MVDLIKLLEEIGQQENKQKISEINKKINSLDEKITALNKLKDDNAKIVEIQTGNLCSSCSFFM